MKAKPTTIQTTSNPNIPARDDDCKTFSEKNRERRSQNILRDCDCCVILLTKAITKAMLTNSAK